MDEGQGRKTDTNGGGDVRNKARPTSISLPRNEKVGNIRQLVSELLPEVKKEVIDNIILNNSKLNNQEYNKEYEERNRITKETNEGVQSNGEGVRGSDDDEVSYKLDEDSRQEGIHSNTRGKNGGRNATPYRYLPNGKTESE